VLRIGAFEREFGFLFYAAVTIRIDRKSAPRISPADDAA
jgi:hypothetical protein